MHIDAMHQASCSARSSGKALIQDSRVQNPCRRPNGTAVIPLLTLRRCKWKSYLFLQSHRARCTITPEIKHVDLCQYLHFCHSSTPNQQAPQTLTLDVDSSRYAVRLAEYLSKPADLFAMCMLSHRRCGRMHMQLQICRSWRFAFVDLRSAIRQKHTLACQAHGGLAA